MIETIQTETVMKETALHKIKRWAIGCLLAFGSVLSAMGQSYPQKPVRVVIGFPPGGGIDIVARLIAPKLSESLGQSVVVDNRPGANGVLAMDHVAKSLPDGHTLFLGTLGNLSINPSFYPNLPFSVDKQFVPITEVASLSFVLFANPGLPVNNLTELVAYAKANPGVLNYSSSGAGGLPHLAGELFSAAVGSKMVHVAYKGSAPSISDVMAGQVQMTFEAAAAGAQQLKAGRLKALGVTGAKRVAFLPDVPAVQEVVPGFEVLNWYGLVAPAGTPKDIVRKLQQDIAKVMALPEIRDKMVAMGTDPVGSSPEEFGLYIKSETIKWGRIIRESNIRPD
jgi:tripartite-type tricarboxylate transporter receptor subunit TctC